jgi:hypothetical protein
MHNRGLRKLRGCVVTLSNETGDYGRDLKLCSAFM